MSNEFKTVWMSQKSLGKTTDQVRHIFEQFIKLSKEKLVVEFHTPETLKLQSELTQARKEIERLREVEKAATAYSDTLKLHYAREGSSGHALYKALAQSKERMP